MISNTEGYADGWKKVIVMISPNGNEVHGIGGDYAHNPNQDIIIEIKKTKTTQNYERNNTKNR